VCILDTLMLVRSEQWTDSSRVVAIEGKVHNSED
jgi:hypothetical protein